MTASVAYQSVDAVAIATIAPVAGTLIAPARGGTTARAAGRKRLRNSAGSPNRSYQPRTRCSAPSPITRIRRRIHSAPYRRPRANIPSAPPTFPMTTAMMVGTGERCSRAARKLPNATMTSAGMGGRKFSVAATRARITYSAAGGSAPSQARTPSILTRRHRHERRDRHTGESFRSANPAHALVGLSLHAHGPGVDAERDRERGPHRFTVRPDLGLLADDGDVRVMHHPPHSANALDCRPQHLNRIPTAILWVRVGEHLADVAGGRCAKDGVGQRVRDGITVGVANERQLRRNRAAAEDHGATGCEAVGVIANAYARRGNR